MKSVNFQQKLNAKRFLGQKNEVISSDYDLIRQFESDRGRIINSAAVRRLQQKTQVFPLERNAFVRTRLTHSMEVQQVGRHIFKEIVARLQQNGQFSAVGLTPENAIMIESIIEMSCLMHDIGNPPFGHFGEAAINQWFRARMDIVDKKRQSIDPNQDFCVYEPIQLHGNADDTEDTLNQLKRQVRQDLCHFEGNAQAIRLTHSLLKLNLTYSQITAILKYTRPAYWIGKAPEDFDYLMKKPGFYLSEEAFIQELYQALDMPPFTRYPLTYVMEAADDISYCIADLEDAVEKRIFTVPQLYQLLYEAWGDQGAEHHLFTETVGKVYQRYLQTDDDVRDKNDEFFVNLRVNIIGRLVPHAVERFIENIEEIAAGTFNEPLLAKHAAEVHLLNTLKKVAFKHVFTHDSIETLELQGNKIIHGLLDIYGALLALSADDFYALIQDNDHKHYLIETRLLHRLPMKYRMAYRDAVRALAALQQTDAETYAVYEFYYRCRLIQDYISGMTDHFAYDEYRKLMISA